MDRAAAEAFLAEPRILLLALNRGGGEPFLVPVWYEYRERRFLIWSASGDAKVALARRNPAVTVCVQDERRPYKSIIVRGRAAVVPGLDRDLARRLVGRYVGPDASASYLSWIDGEPDESGVTIVVTPSAWRAADYAEGRESADHAPWVSDAEFR
jgi:PPOX class probable F420-dependent enzyme